MVVGLLTPPSPPPPPYARRLSLPSIGAQAYRLKDEWENKGTHLPLKLASLLIKFHGLVPHSPPPHTHTSSVFDVVPPVTQQHHTEGTFSAGSAG